jgi:hypothetical protein
MLLVMKLNDEMNVGCCSDERLVSIDLHLFGISVFSGAAETPQCAEPRFHPHVNWNDCLSHKSYRNTTIFKYHNSPL